MSVNPMIKYSDIIAETASNHWNVRDEFKDNTLEENRQIQLTDGNYFAVGIINVTGDLNVGMMIRTACLLGAEDVFVFGRKKIDKRSSVGAENYIPISYYTYEDPLSMEDELIDDIQRLSQGYTPVLVEQGGTPLQYHDHNSIDYPLFLFGSESHGIPEEVCKAFPNHISIPQWGVLRSYNVSSAMSMVCWDYVKTLNQ